MGCDYDMLNIDCPNCGEELEFQCDGEYNRYRIGINYIPNRILNEFDGETTYCDECGRKYRFRLNYKIDPDIDFKIEEI